MYNLYSNVHVFFFFFPEGSEVRKDTDFILNCSDNFLLYAFWKVTGSHFVTLFYVK